MEQIKQMPTNTKIAAQLRKAILSGQYSGGEELSLTNLSKELGVSRTPVREAFQKLASEGLITLRMNKGAIVNNIDEKFIIDHFNVRILLECEAVKLATYNQMNVSKLLKLETELSNHPENATLEDYSSINQKIHRSIWDAANNQKLTQILEELWNGASINTKRPPLEHHLKSVQEHLALLNEIKVGHAKKASQIMRQHLKRSEQNVLSSFTTNISSK